MSNCLGINLKYLRKKRFINQSEIASLLNKGSTTIGNWEHGIAEPNITELNTLATYFNVSIDELINADLANNQMSTGHVNESTVTYGKSKKSAKNDPGKEGKDAVIQAQKITIETLQKALVLAEEQIKLLRKSPF